MQHAAPFANISWPLRRRRVVMFVDLVDSVSHMQLHESDVIERWRQFVAIARDRLAPGHEARVVRTAGDAILIECDQVRAAAHLSLELHRLMHTLNAPVDSAARLWLRAGIHVAEVLVEEHDLLGSGTNLAARIATLAVPGGTVVSTDVRNALVDGADGQITDLGLCFLKGFSDPVRAFRLDDTGAAGGIPADPAPQTDLRPVVAVIPLLAVPADPAGDAIGHAIASEVIASLSRHPGVRVLSRLSTVAFRGQDPDWPRLKRLLGANFALTGVFYQVGDSVRVSTELSHVDDGQVLWAGQSTARVDDLFQGTDDLIPALVTQVAQGVIAHELARVKRLPMNTLESYALYLGASGLMSSLARDDFDHARRVLEHLAERHPRQAAPRAMLSLWHVNRAVQGWSADVRQDGLAAQDMAQRAMALDPDQPIALRSDGLARMNFLNDVEGARACYLQALQLDAQDPSTWAQLSAVHSQCGEHDAALAAAERAITLSPLDPSAYLFESYAAAAALGGEQFESALRHASASVRHHALHAPSHRLLIASLWLLGRHNEARLAASRYLAVHPQAVAQRGDRRFSGHQPVWGARFVHALTGAGLPP